MHAERRGLHLQSVNRLRSAERARAARAAESRSLLRLPDNVVQEEHADIKAISTLRDLCGLGFVGSSACLMFEVLRQLGQFEDFFFLNPSFALERSFYFPTIASFHK